MKKQASPNGWLMVTLGVIPLFGPAFLILYVTREKFRMKLERES